MNNLNNIGCDINDHFHYLEDLNKKNNLNQILLFDFLKIIKNVILILDKIIREKKPKKVVMIEKIMYYLIQLSKTKFLENEEIYVILNNYYSLILKFHKKLENMQEKIKEIFYFKKKSKNLNKKHFYGLFTNLAVEFLIKTGKYNTSLKLLKKSINFYQDNKFFEKKFNKKEVLNIKKVYIINRMYLLICLKQFELPKIEIEKKKNSLFNFCEDNFPENILFKSWIEKNFQLKKNLKIIKDKKISKSRKKKSICDKNLTMDFDNISLKIKCPSSTNKKTDKKSNQINYKNKKNLIPYKLKDKKKISKKFSLTNRNKKSLKIKERKISLNISSKRLKNNKYNTFFKFFKEDLIPRENKKALKSFKDTMKKKIIRAKLVEKLNFILSDEKKQINKIRKINKKIFSNKKEKDNRINNNILNLFLKRKKKKLEISKNKNYFFKSKEIDKKLTEDLEKISQKKNFEKTKKIHLRKKRRSSSFRIKKIKTNKFFKTPFLNYLLNNSKYKNIPQKIDIKYFYFKNKKFKFKIIYINSEIQIFVIRKKIVYLKKLLKIEEIDFLFNQEENLNILPPFLIKKTIMNLNQIFKYYINHLMIFKKKTVKLTSMENEIINLKKKKMEIIFNNLPNSILKDIELKRFDEKYIFSIIYLTGKIFRIFFYQKIKNQEEPVKICFFIDLKFTKKDIEKFFDIILINSALENKNIFENIISYVKIKKDQKDFFISKLNFLINKNFENFCKKTKYCFFYNYIFIEDFEHLKFKYFKIKKSMRKNYFEIIFYSGFENRSKLEISLKELKNYWFLKNNQNISEIEYESISFYLVNLIKYNKKDILNINNIKMNISITNSYKLFLSKLKIICRKIIFLKDMYFIPVNLNLIFITENQFLVQIIFKDIYNLVYRCSYFFLENFLNFWIEKNSNKIFKKEIILKFNKYDWKNFIRKNIILEENSLIFKSNFLFLNTLIIN